MNFDQFNDKESCLDYIKNELKLNGYDQLPLGNNILQAALTAWGDADTFNNGIGGKWFLKTYANMFNRVMCGMPLTELEDIEDQWVQDSFSDNILRHKRYSPVWKDKNTGKYYDDNYFLIYDREHDCYFSASNSGEDSRQEVSFPYFPRPQITEKSLKVEYDLYN